MLDILGTMILYLVLLAFSLVVWGVMAYGTTLIVHYAWLHG